MPVFVQDLKQLLQAAMPTAGDDAKKQLLLHQFLCGLPDTVSKQLRANVEIKDIIAAADRAQLIMALDEKYEVAAVPVESTSQVQRLEEKIIGLQEQVAALVKVKEQRRCYNCQQIGHIKRNCPQKNVFCYNCGKLGHTKKFCHQLNKEGEAGRGGSCPSQ